jgi:murein L,D-transpeptidase YcbB/YkuD
MRMRDRRTIAACVALLFSAGCGYDTARDADALRAIASGTPAWIDDTAVGRKLWEIERTFYEDRGHAPAWIERAGTTPQLTDLVQQLKLSAQHGLEPEVYGTGDFEREIEASTTRWRGTRFDEARVPELDARLTYAYLRYAADLLGWTTSPRDIRRDWLVEPRDANLAAGLAEAVSSTDVRKTLEALAPAHPQYQGLKAALAEERSPDRAARIRMNMERWRWAPRELGERYVLVNVPAYQMQVIEGDDPVLAMRVIVGAPDTPTPLFSDLMTYVVFSPYWNIPESILREETLPKVAADPRYLERNHIEVLKAGRVVDPESVDWSDEGETRGLRFRQAPGPENALGLVKFIFPNHFSVYLHDTPADGLFARDERALSHGCIRVENPVALAEYVLRARPEWTADRIRAAMQTDDEQSVKLQDPLRVHIGYWTAWVEPDGKTVTFTADPYGIDGAQAKNTRYRQS